jgi:RNA polymerase sigma factor
LSTSVALQRPRGEQASSVLLDPRRLLRSVYLGRLPIAGLLPGFSLSRKTLEKNRKYIIALYLIMKSDMEILKGYIESYIKGADAR